MMIPLSGSFVFSTKFLLIQVLLIQYFGFMMGISRVYSLVLALFSLEILLLKMSFGGKAARYRGIILVLLVVSALVYAGALPMSHPSWDAQHYYKDIQSLRQGQSPYSGALSCGMNQNFVPTFALCAALGDSYAKFHANLELANVISPLLCVLLIVCGLLYFLRKARLNTQRRIEVCLETVVIGALFFIFFKRNMIIGNISAWAAPLVLGLMGAHYLGSWVLAGLFLGSAITIKPFLLTAALGYGILFVLKKDKHSLKILAIALSVLVGTAILIELFVDGLGMNTYYEFFTSVALKRPLGMMINVSNVSAPAVLMGMLRNMGVPIDAAIMSWLSILLLLPALGAGAFLLKRTPQKHLPLGHLVYFLLLSTAVSPIIWIHYFSWLVGPAMYVLWKLAADEEKRQLIPSFLLGCIILTFDSLAWIGALALPAIAFISAYRGQSSSVPLPCPVALDIAPELAPADSPIMALRQNQTHAS